MLFLNASPSEANSTIEAFMKLGFGTVPFVVVMGGLYAFVNKFGKSLIKDQRQARIDFERDAKSLPEDPKPYETTEGVAVFLLYTAGLLSTLIVSSLDYVFKNPEWDVMGYISYITDEKLCSFFVLFALFIVLLFSAYLLVLSAQANNWKRKADEGKNTGLRKRDDHPQKIKLNGEELNI